MIWRERCTAHHHKPPRSDLASPREVGPGKGGFSLVSRRGRKNSPSEARRPEVPVDNTADCDEGHGKCPTIHAVDRILGLNSTRSPIEVICLAGQPAPVLLSGLDLGKTRVNQRDLSKGSSEADRSWEPKGASRSSWAWGADLD